MQHVRAKRIRGRALQRQRQRVLARQPLCVDCLARDRVTAAQYLHHDKPLYEGGGNEDENMVPLCIDCHELRHGRRPEIGPDGWPVE